MRVDVSDGLACLSIRDPNFGVGAVIIDALQGHAVACIDFEHTRTGGAVDHVPGTIVRADLADDLGLAIDDDGGAVLMELAWKELANGRERNEVRRPYAVDAANAHLVG